MLLAAVRWVNFTTWQLWPSVGHWAAHAGIAERSGRRVLRQLEKKGLIRVVRSSVGGVTGFGRKGTSVYELQLPEFLQDPAILSVVTGDPARKEPGLTVREPGPSVPRTRTSGAETPDTASANPSMHQPAELSKEPSSAGPDSCARGDAWMQKPPADTTAAEDPTDLLRVVGVRGPNLDKLVASGVTAAQIRTEVRHIQRDPGVRNLPAVLVQRLAAQLGATLSTRASLAPAAREVIGQIENIRRHAPKRPDATKVGDVLSLLTRGQSQARPGREVGGR